jgi:hypothetical protein
VHDDREVAGIAALRTTCLFVSPHNFPRAVGSQGGEKCIAMVKRIYCWTLLSLWCICISVPCIASYKPQVLSQASESFLLRNSVVAGMT